jgi:predicted ATP-dependent protease
MLDKEVIEAVREDKFHLYSIEKIDEGLELLLEKPAEEIHQSVQQKLIEYAELEEENDGEEKSDD